MCKEIVHDYTNLKNHQTFDLNPEQEFKLNKVLAVDQNKLNILSYPIFKDENRLLIFEAMDTVDLLVDGIQLFYSSRVAPARSSGVSQVVILKQTDTLEKNTKRDTLSFRDMNRSQYISLWGFQKTKIDEKLLEEQQLGKVLKDLP